MSKQDLAVDGNVANPHPRIVPRHDDAPRATGVATSPSTAKTKPWSLRLNHRKVAEAYTNEAISCVELGERLGCGRTTICRILERMGVKRKRKPTRAYKRRREEQNIHKQPGEA